MNPANLPTGTVTFFFSDVEDSTGLLQRTAADYKDVIERHAAIVRACLARHNGIEVSTEGDSFFAVFVSAPDAVAGAAAVQQQLAAAEWPPGGTVQIRIGLHTGAGELGGDNYLGLDVNRAARISAAGHGGQVLVSGAVTEAAPQAEYSDLGEHALKGLEAPEHLYQLEVAGLPQSFPPPRTRTIRPHNLPALASRIVGRQAELAELKRLVGEHRLVTILGPGGIGKTRLALEVAGNVVSRFEGGTYFVDLAPLDDPDLVNPTIASTVGVPGNGELASSLSDEARLLVLDNLEQLAGSFGSLAGLLSAAPPLRVLATSQLPLHVGGEEVFRLRPLATDDESSPAVELFTARATLADPSFDPEAHREDVQRLVEALDGVPLAIELAAARSNVLTPAQILDRLAAGFLQSRRSDAAERHSSITAAVEWSYDMLSPAQQAALQALSVFRGGATLDALSAVADSDPLDALGELVDRSLVEAEAGTVGKRFDLLAPVRLFLHERIDPNSAAELTSKHTGFFQQLARNAHEPLEWDGKGRWLMVLADDHDNLSATLDHLLHTGDTDGGYDMLGDIWRFFQSTGRLNELDLWLGRFFAADHSAQPTRARARALLARAALLYWRTDAPGCAAAYEEALEIAEAIDDDRIKAESLLGLATIRGIAAARGQGLALGDPQEAFERSEQIYRELGDTRTVAVMQFGRMAITAAMSPEPQAADIDLLDKLIDMWKETGSLTGLAHTELQKAESLIFQEDFAGAQQAALDSIDTAARAGDTFTMAWALHRLAIPIVEAGDTLLGVRLVGAAREAMRNMGGTFLPPLAPIAPAEERAGAALDEEQVAAALEDGRELSLMEAVQLAREAAGRG